MQAITVLSFQSLKFILLRLLCRRNTARSDSVRIYTEHLDLGLFAFCGSNLCNYRQLVALGGEFRGGCPSLTSSLSFDRKVRSSVLFHWLQWLSNKRLENTAWQGRRKGSIMIEQRISATGQLTNGAWKERKHRQRRGGGGVSRIVDLKILPAFYIN